MALLDSLKDPNTGKIKTPILISLVGAGGLLAYLVLKGSGSTTTSAGQSSSLTPDLTGLADALKNLGAGGTSAGGSAGGAGGGTVAPPDSGTTIPTTPTDNGGVATYSGGGSAYNPVADLPYTPVITPAPTSNGVAGGGGGGTGAVVQPSAKAPTVYGGVTVSPATAMNYGVAASSILNSPSLTGQPIGTSQILSSPSLTGNTPIAAPLTSAQILAAKVAQVAAAHPGATQSAILATAKKDLATQAGTAATPILNSPSLTVAPVKAITSTTTPVKSPNQRIAV